MDPSAKYQLNVIMDNLKEMKLKYTNLQKEYSDLEVLYDKQKQRFVNLENCRNQLIKLFKEKVEKVDCYKADIESLQKENSNLSCTIQDQNLQINEFSASIEQLKKENALLKSKRKESNYPKNIIEKGIKQPNQTHVNGINGICFSHPSFDVSTTEIKKKKKKSPLVLQNRYSNLDILVNGTPRKEELTKENIKMGSAKKRRLFSLEDEMIDLTIENKE